MPRLRPTAILSLCLATALTALVTAAEVQHWRYEGANELLASELENVSVDSFGRLRLAPEAEPLAPLDVAYVWALAPAGEAAVFVATGDDGRILRVGKEKAEVYFDAPEIHVQALALAPDGRLFAATSPDGRVYAIDKSRQATVFFDPEDRYIWALRFDSHGDLWVACGGQARLYRVHPDGTAQTPLTSPESHLTALELGPRGDVFVGTSPGGLLYRVEPSGSVTSLVDSSFKEVRAIVAQADGSLLAAVVMETAKDREDGRTGSGGVSSGDITVTETITVIGPTGQPAPAAQATPVVVQPLLAKGALLRVAADGDIRSVWSSGEDMPLAMAPAGPGDVWLATGPRARLYRVREDRLWQMVTTLPSEQATALLAARDGGVLVGTSNAGRVYTLAKTLAGSGTLTFKVRDAATIARWGRVAWQGEAPTQSDVVVETRSGNSATPDGGWSEWAAAGTGAESGGTSSSASREARFLQTRLRLAGTKGATPVVHSVVAALLQRNLPPSLTAISVYGPGEVFQKVQAGATDGEILGLDPEDTLPQNRPAGLTPPVPATTPGPFNKKLYMRGLQTFSWGAGDPNGDELLFDVEYRAIGTPSFQLLRGGLREAMLTWDTAVVPNGRYVVRVRARDNPSNPESLALADEMEGGTFDVDNVPPAFQIETTARKGIVRVTVRDQHSPIRRVDYSVAGGTWQELRPVDGLADSPTEIYAVDTVAIRGAPMGSTTPLMLRAMDAMGNVASEQVVRP